MRDSALVEVGSFEAGRWDPLTVIRQGPRGSIALLVVDGVLLREVQTGGRTSAELFGAGDLIQPCEHDAIEAQEPAAWKALGGGRVAVLDQRLLVDAAQALSVLAALARRSVQRGRSLGMLALTRTMRRTDQRLLFLLSFFAARWGRVRADGVRLALPLSHETLARLIGTRRQSVTTALGELRAQGLLRMLPDGDWLLPRQPVPPQAVPAAPEPPPPVHGRLRTLPPGAWDAAAEYRHHHNWLGLLVLNGFLARRTSYRQETTLEIIGPDDLIQPWEYTDNWLPDVTISWSVLVPSELALLDDQLVRRLASRPGLTAEILGRASRRARWLALRLAISQQTNLRCRLTCLFAQLARRWGGVDALTLPLPLTHAQIAELVGAERPSVSATLADLCREGVLGRLRDGTWQVTAECQALACAVDRREMTREPAHHR